MRKLVQIRGIKCTDVRLWMSFCESQIYYISVLSIVYIFNLFSSSYLKLSVMLEKLANSNRSWSGPARLAYAGEAYLWSNEATGVVVTGVFAPIMFSHWGCWRWVVSHRFKLVMYSLRYYIKGVVLRRWWWFA